MGLPTVGELYGSLERLKYLSTNTRLQLRRAQHSNEGAVAEFLQTASHMSWLYGFVCTNRFGVYSIRIWAIKTTKRVSFY